MVKVTLTDGEDTPSAKLVAAAKKSVDITDATGRTITVRRAPPLAKLDFAKAAGGAEINQFYLAEVMHLQFVGAIDGEPVITPATDGELRALYARLGDEGNEAVQLAVFEHFLGGTASSEAALKNS